MSENGVALCLNSSFLGYYAHAGFLEAFTGLHGRPARIAGASAGGFVAGLYAAGLAPADIVAFALSTELRNAFFEWNAGARGFRTLLNRKGNFGVLGGKKVLSLMHRTVGARRIEECDPPLSLAVTNLTAARSEVITSGPLAEFIVATCAFPILFTARDIEGQLYWDGGIANSMPFGHWADDPAIDTIVVHAVTHRGESDARAGGRSLNVFDAVNLSHQLICDELVRAQIERVERAGKRLVFLRTNTPKPRIGRPKTWPELVEIGRRSARGQAESLAAVIA